METLDLVQLLSLRRDASIAKGKREWIVASWLTVPTARECFDLLTSAQMRLHWIRFALETRKGTRWDRIARQGVHSPKGDVAVEGTGHAMRSDELRNIATWSYTAGVKVNEGSGIAHRTLKVDALLFWRTNGITYATPYGVTALAKALGKL
jgi:hypothetical protein